MDSSLESIKEELLCPICLTLFKNAVQLPCEHTFCRECIEKYLGEQRITVFCPNCRKTFSRNELIGSRTIDNVILRIWDNDSNPCSLDMPTQRHAINKKSSEESRKAAEQIPEKKANEKQMTESEYIRSKFVSITLDSETAHPFLEISDDKKSVYCSPGIKSFQPSQKRFDKINAVLAEQVFDGGEHYWEVIVNDKKRWSLGITKDSLNRNGAVQAFPRYGYWIIMRRTEGWFLSRVVYEAWEDTKMLISVRSKPNKIGIHLNCDSGELSFYNADIVNNLEKIYTFRGIPKNVVPFFDPCWHDGGGNSHPLQICSEE